MKLLAHNLPLSYIRLVHARAHTREYNLAEPLYAPLSRALASCIPSISHVVLWTTICRDAPVGVGGGLRGGHGRAIAPREDEGLFSRP